MADLGDIGHFLDEEPVNDLSWLEVSPEEYRLYMETLPHQNLDSVPELLAHFKDLTDAQAFHLAAENREPVQPTTPFWSERPHFGRITDAEAVALVEHFTKAQVQAGVKAKQVIANLKLKFDPRTLKASLDRIRAVLGERGLLGSVYLDSRLFPKCAAGGLVRDLTATNRQANYVLAKSECVDCVHNKEGRCAVFTKQLVFDVQYDESLWDQVKGRLRDKDIADLQGLPVKERIQQAMLRAPRAKEIVQGHKPVQAHLADSVSPQEAAKRLMASESTQEIVGNVQLRRKQLRWAKAMLSGEHGPTIVERVKHDPDLAPLKQDLHLMGPLYANIAYFPTYKEAASFIEALDTPPPFIVGIPYNETEITSYTSASFVDVRHADLLSPVLNRYLELTHGPTQKRAAKHQERFDKLWRMMRHASREEALSFAQGVYARPLPQRVQMHAAKYIYDPTEGITEGEALDRFAAYTPERVKVANQRKVANRTEVIEAMLSGDHGKRVSTLVASDPSMRDLQAHLHLLGRLYVDTSLVTAKQLATLGERYAHLAQLPYLTDNNRETFFTSAHAHAPIAARMADVKQLEGNARQSYLRRTLEKLAKLSGPEVQKLAHAAYARPIKAKVATHGSPYRQWRPEYVSNDRMRAFVERLANTKTKRAFKVLEDYLRQAGGDRMLDRLSKRLGYDTLNDIYLGGDERTASKRASSSPGRLKQARKIIEVVTASDFKAKGSIPPLGAFFKTRAGRFMRDRMMAGSYGARLSDDIKRAFSYEKIVDQAPVVLAMREEEGLYGRAYVVADAYDDCHLGAEKTATTVNQVVEASKCTGCRFNVEGQCKVYGRKLVASPQYSDATVDRALGQRVRKGELTQAEASRLREASGTAKQRTYLAHTAFPHHNAKHSGYAKAHHGALEQRGVDVAKAQAYLQQREAAKHEAQAQFQKASDTSSSAPTGYALMNEFDFAPSTGGLDFDLHAEGPGSFDMEMTADWQID